MRGLAIIALGTAVAAGCVLLAALAVVDGAGCRTTTPHTGVIAGGS